MTRSKKMTLLVSLLLIFIVIYLLTLKFGGEKEENSIAFTDIKISDIEKISWSYSGDEIEIIKSDDKWTWSEDDNYPINQTKADDLADAVANLEAATALTDADSSEYGLDNTEPNVKITLKGGEEKSITLGDTNDILDQCYLMISGDDTIYLVDSSIKDTFNIDIDSLLQMESIPYISDANEISITKGDAQMTLTLSEDEDGNNRWKSGETILDTDKVNDIKTGLNSIAWNDCVEYNADETKIAEYGLNTPYASAKWQNESESIEIEFGNNAGEGERYARIKGSNMVYTVSSGVEENLVTDYNTLIKQDETSQEQTEE